MGRSADTTGLWTFADITHPVYTRPEDATSWEFGDKRFRAPEYVTPPTQTDRPVKEQFPTSERLGMEMIGAPSVTVYQHETSANTIQMVRLNTRYMDEVNLDAIRPLVRQWWELLREMSTGTVTTKDLRKAENPYGYGPTPSEIRKMMRKGKPPPAERTWELLKHPRKLPAQGRRHFRGIRGSVANRDIINRQSGTLYDRWNHTIVRRDDGITLLFYNTAKSESGAPYPWFLFHGTIYMQAHGPWGVVAQRLLGKLHAAWIRECREAQKRDVRRAQALEVFAGANAMMTPRQVQEAMI